MSKFALACIAFIASVAGIAPAFLYLYRWFDWNDRTSWVEGASFFSDIYVPIFTMLSILFIGYQIRDKIRSDRIAFLSESIKRRSVELSTITPENPNQLFGSVRASVLRGADSQALDALAFMKNHSRYVYALLGTTTALAELRKLDRQVFNTLRLELFMLVDRDVFEKYEYILYAAIRPSPYEWLCGGYKDDFKNKK